MGYLFVFLVVLFFIFFLWQQRKKVQQKQQEEEIFGEILSLDRTTQKVTLQTRRGIKEYALQQNIWNYLSIGKRGIFVVSKNQLISFTPYDTLK